MTKRIRQDAEKRNTYAVAAVRSSPFGGHAHVAFKFVMIAWKRICGGLPVAVLTGSVLIAVPLGLSENPPSFIFTPSASLFLFPLLRGKKGRFKHEREHDGFLVLRTCQGH